MKNIAFFLIGIFSAYSAIAQSTAEDVYVSAVIGSVSFVGLFVIIGLYRLGKLFILKLKPTSLLPSESPQIPLSGSLSLVTATPTTFRKTSSPVAHTIFSNVPHDGQVSASMSIEAVSMRDFLEAPPENPTEACWSAAFSEFESPARRIGLWAKSFAESDGNEAVAKAAYLRIRASELQAENGAVSSELQAVVVEAVRKQAADQAAANAELKQAAKDAERQRADEAYAALPKGMCPNKKCGAILPLNSQACPKCFALFEDGAAWKVRPIKTT